MYVIGVCLWWMHTCVCVLRLKEVFECPVLSETGFLIKPGARLAASKL